MARRKNVNDAIPDAISDALRSDVIRTFIMLRFFLQDTNLCENDRRGALRIYLRGISAVKVDEIRRSCPQGINNVYSVSAKDKQASPTEQQVVDAVIKTAKKDMIKDPESFLGRDGWFMALARDLARVPARDSKKNAKSNQSNSKRKSREESPDLVQNFGFGEFETSLFLAITAFARVSRPDETFTDRTKAVIQFSFWHMFKLDDNDAICDCPLNPHLLQLIDVPDRIIRAKCNVEVSRLKDMVLAMTKEMANYAPQLSTLETLEKMYMCSADLERKLPFLPASTEARWSSVDLERALYDIKKDREQKAREAEDLAKTKTAEQ